MTIDVTGPLDQRLEELGAAAAAASASAVAAVAAAAEATTKAQEALDQLAALPTAPVPEVTQEEYDALVAHVEANRVAASDEVVHLSDMVDKLEAADRTEDDKQSADIIALANRVGSGPVAANPGNEILLDSFAGTDEQKLDQAWVVAQASSPRRPIRLSARPHTLTKTRTTFSGLRILGPNVGWQNPEIAGSGGSLPQCTVTLNCGTGASSWLVGTATTYDVTVAGICFKSDNGSTQFYHHPYSAGTAYATRLHELTFYGFKHVVGMPGNAFAMTLNTFSGTWTCVGVRGTQFSLRGSDNFLWKNGEINYGWWGENAGQYLIRFENLMKTSVANMYLTARDGARAVLVDGTNPNQGGLDISDCVIEGNNKDQPAYGALIVVKGGGVSFTNIKLNFGMRDPSRFTDQADTALVMVMAGLAVFRNIWTCRAELMAATVPIFDVRSGATAHVDHVLAMQGYTMGQQLPYKVAAATTTAPAGRLVADATLKAA